jgi:hypothetical protein
MVGSQSNVTAVLATAVAGFILVAAVYLTPLASFAQERPTRPDFVRQSTPNLNLDPDDEAATLVAIAKTLSEVSDGATYVWQRSNGRLSGSFRPIRTFRDATGRTCRDLAITLTAGPVTRSVTGPACRESDRSWSLSG